jgi:hypothetical protein
VVSSWLSSAWNEVKCHSIARSFTTCFLGDSLLLHIARCATYGPFFRIKMAELDPRYPLIEKQIDFGSESDLNDIDDS